MKRQDTHWEKIFANPLSNKIFIIYKEPKLHSKRQKSNLKISQMMHQMILHNKEAVKRYLTSVAITEVRIETT